MGTTSWTGAPEVGDYRSVVGMLVYYLQHHLDQSNEVDVPQLDLINGQVEQEAKSKPTQLLLAGYSFGSLILARLPSITNILQTFESAEHGTAAGEIFLRARTLARQTLRNSRPPSTPGPRKHQLSNSTSSPMTLGGEETPPSERRRSKDSQRHHRSVSVSTVREMPHRIKTHIRRHSGSNPPSSRKSESASAKHSDTPQAGPQVEVKYLLISPVLFPLSTWLLPPGIIPLSRTQTAEAEAGVMSLKYPTLVVFGDLDQFTSVRRLRDWAGRLKLESGGKLTWTQVDGAGHFWREDEALVKLAGVVEGWLHSENGRVNW